MKWLALIVLERPYDAPGDPYYCWAPSTTGCGGSWDWLGLLFALAFTLAVMVVLSLVWHYLPEAVKRHLR